MWADTARQDDNLGKRFRTYLREKVRKVGITRIDRQIARQGRKIGVLLMQERHSSHHGRDCATSGWSNLDEPVPRYS